MPGSPVATAWRRGAGVIAFVLLAGAAPVRAEPLSVMHGFADQSSFTLWVQADRPTRIAVEFAVEGAAAAPRVVRRDALEDQDFAVSLRLANLEPGTRYGYRLLADGAPTGTSGAFRTQPVWEWRTDPPDVSIAIGSCAYVNDGRFDRPGPPFGAGYGIFDAIADQRPELMLWLGDNVYFREPEWTSLEAMSARYRFYRALPELQRLWRSTSHVAVWDDHDYGPNDGDASFVMKGAAFEAFRRYWPNPTHGLPGVSGIFTQLRVADADFFLLDDRWYRYPNRYPVVPEKALLGAQQLEWLRQALLASHATFKVVAMGTQFWNRASRFETWQNYPDEQRRLRDWLGEQRIAGVVFLSGDRHFSELLRLPREGAYPLYEFTSSPLTAGVVSNPDEQERGNPDLVPGTLVTQRNFGMLRLHGPRGARALAFESYDAGGALLWRRIVTAAELR
jgi:alkaline phosphatase D